MSKAHSQNDCILDGKSRLAVMSVTLKCMSKAHSQNDYIQDGKSGLAVLSYTKVYEPSLFTEQSHTG